MVASIALTTFAAWRGVAAAPFERAFWAAGSAEGPLRLNAIVTGLLFVGLGYALVRGGKKPHFEPICAHLGLKPQSVHKLGGFKVQGRNGDAGQRMVEEARALESAGADCVLLECVPNGVGAAIRDALTIPVIGIGAGPSMDGQILVLYDVLGITQGRMPRFVKNYMKGRDSPLEA